MTYPNAAAGLKTVQQAEPVELISIVPVFFPIIQVFAAAALLVAGILTLIGLYQCRKDDSGLRRSLCSRQLTCSPVLFPASSAPFSCWQLMFWGWHRCTLYTPPPTAC